MIKGKRVKIVFLLQEAGSRIFSEAGFSAKQDFQNLQDLQDFQRSRIFSEAGFSEFTGFSGFTGWTGYALVASKRDTN